MTDWWQQRYWRIRFVGTQDAAKSPRIARIRFDGNTTDDWTINDWGVSDTGYRDANSNNAADTDPATNWISGTSAPNSWVGARIYGGPAQIKTIDVQATNDANFGGAPSAFWVEGSNDPDGALPVNWQRLAYCACGTWTQGSTQSFVFTGTSTADTADITRVAAEFGYSAARTALLSTVSAEVLQKPSGVKTRLSALTTQVLIQNVNNATGNGVTIPVAQTLLSGAVHISGIATSSTTDAVVYGGDPVTSNGDPVVLSMAGTAATSLIPGYATAPGYVTASGSTLVATRSIIPGAASNFTGTNATANGDVVVATRSLIAGTASAQNGAVGGTLVATHSLIAGTATGAWDLGQTIVNAYSVLSGNAQGSANVGGDTVTETFLLLNPTEAGAAAISGDRVTETFSFTPGAATGEKNASVPAQNLGTTCSIVAGLVTTSSSVSGQTLVETDTFISGGAVISSLARGNILPFTPSVLRGSVTVDTEVLGRVIHVDFGLPENTLGVVTAGANTPAQVVAFSHQVINSGTATGTAVAQGEIVSFSHAVINGALRADANIDPALIFNVSVTLDPGVGFWFIGAPGDVMLDPHVDARMELLAEVRRFTVSVETRAIIVPHEDRVIALGPRLKQGIAG